MKKKNKVININSMMSALENYVEQALNGEVGVPINYYTKLLLKDEIEQLWIDDNYPEYKENAREDAKDARDDAKDARDDAKDETDDAKDETDDAEETEEDEETDDDDIGDTA